MIVGSSTSATIVTGFVDDPAITGSGSKTPRRGLWVTDRPLTALETAAAVPDGSVFLDRALQRHVSFARVYRAYCRNLGARGSARAGELLVAAADRADSAAERRAVALMRAAGITGWVLGHRFGNYVIDIAFPDAMLAWRSTAGPGMGVDLPQPPGAATVQITGGINAGPRPTAAFRTDRHKSNALVRARAGICCDSPGTT